MKSLILTAALLALTCATARADDAPPTKMSPMMLKQANAKFLQMAHSGNLLEIELSQYALDQLKGHADVRELAAMVVEHHKNADKMVQEAAAKSGVKLADELSSVDKAILDQAKAVHGELYHVPYLFRLASSHVESILGLSYMEHFTNNDAVKAYCRTVLPKMKMHYRKILPLAEKEARAEDGLTGK